MVGFPLLLIPLALYNIIVFLMPGVSFTDTLFKIPMVSGAEWPVTLTDVLIALGIVLLLLEVIKGARPGAKYLTDHFLSLIVFGAAAAELVMWPKFANSTYFLLTLLAMADFISGVALRTRRRVVMTDAAPVLRRAKEDRKEKLEPAAAEPQFDPAPAPQPAPQQNTGAPQPASASPEPRDLPSARSVAESVLMNHPAPNPVQSPAQPAPDSPETASPQPEPHGTAPASPETPQRD